MKDKKVRKIVWSALLAALVCVTTMVVQIPSPAGGYTNLGDCFVLLSGWLLGPWYGAAAAGIGSMLTDLFLGYAYYAPGTFVIKGLDAMAAALLYRALGRRFAGQLAGGVAGGVLMAAGYFGYAALILGRGEGALLSIPGNLLQAAVGLVAALLVMAAFKHGGVLKYVDKSLN